MLVSGMYETAKLSQRGLTLPSNFLMHYFRAGVNCLVSFRYFNANSPQFCSPYNKIWMTTHDKRNSTDVLLNSNVLLTRQSDLRNVDE